MDIGSLLLHLPRRYRRSTWKSVQIWEEIGRRYGTSRIVLPNVDMEVLFPGFTEARVEVTRLPVGDWSSPVLEQLVLAKLGRVIDARRILEIGSYRGFTARLLAENLPSAEVVALDIDPRGLGQAYAGSDAEARIVRLIGTVDDVPGDSKFDLIFVDGNHVREDVERDTAAALAMLSDLGVLVWHDYTDAWGWLAEANQVPEYVNRIARDIAIGRVYGLAIHRCGWTHADIEAATTDGRG